MVKVSVVIPVFNVENYLRECLDSLLSQTLADMEFICVNDGSTDHSLEILQEYAERDGRFKVISKPNSGYGHSMNVGLDAAEGEYIGIVEPDDYVQTDMYETLYEIAKKKDIDVIKADFYRFTGSKPHEKREYNHLSKKKEDYNKILNPQKYPEVFRFIMNTWSGIYKRAFLEKYHIRHNETPGASFQDNGFWFQTFCLATRLYFLDRPFYMNRRDNPGSSVHNREKVYCASVEYKFIKEFLERNPELKEKFIYMYSLRKFDTFNFTLTRIGEEYRREFLKHFGEEFRQAREAGELDCTLFTPYQKKCLEEIMEDPDKYYFAHYGNADGHENNVALTEKVIDCVKTYGVVYTLKKIWSKLK